MHQRGPLQIQICKNGTASLRGKERPLLVIENPKKPKLLGKNLDPRSEVPWSYAPPAGTLPARSSGRWKHPSGFEGCGVWEKIGPKQSYNPRILDCNKDSRKISFKINIAPYTSSSDSVEDADVL